MVRHCSDGGLEIRRQALADGVRRKRWRQATAIASSTRDGVEQLLHGPRRMPGDERVDVRQRGGHPAGQRREPGRGLAWVHPDHPVGEPGQPGHLLAQQRRVRTLPAVGHDHDDGSAGQPAPAVGVQEILDGTADPGAAGGVRRQRQRAARWRPPGVRGRVRGSPGAVGWRTHRRAPGPRAPRPAAPAGTPASRPASNRRRPRA